MIKEVFNPIKKISGILSFFLVPLFSYGQTKWIEKDSGTYTKLSVIRYEESNGKKNGRFEIYTNGVLVQRGFYSNDLKDSTWTNYCNSKTAAKRSYKKDQPKGNWLFYDADEKVNIVYDVEAKAYYISNLNNKKKNHKQVNLFKPDHDAYPLFSDFEVKCFLESNLEYPKKSISNKEHGWVEIKMKIDTSGKVSNYAIHVSVSEMLDKEALKKVKLFPFSFIPAYKDGVPKESFYILTVKFPQLYIN